VAMGLTYASRVTGDPKYRNFLLSWYRRAFTGTPGLGKEYAMMLHQTPYALHDLQEVGLSRLPECEPPK